MVLELFGEQGSAPRIVSVKLELKAEVDSPPPGNWIH